MPVRVAVVGQSNSILSTGYVHRLQEQASIRIGATARLGASPSLLLPFFCDAALLRGHDVVIFDLAVIDQGFLWAGALDPYAIVRWLEHGIRQAHAARCLPLLLVIPHQAAITTAGARAPVSFLHQLYRAVAKANGALCFDLFDAILRRHRRDPAATAAIYDDPDHLSRGFSGEVARRIAAVLAEAGDLAGIPRRARRAAMAEIERVAVTAPVMAQRRSGLLSADFAAIGPGEKVVVSIGTGSEVIGALINRTASAGRLRIAGRTTLVKEIGTPREAGEFTAQLVPFSPVAADARGNVTISIAAGDEIPTEASWQAVAGGRPGVEVATLLIEGGQAVMPYDEPMLPPPLQQTDWFR